MRKSNGFILIELVIALSMLSALLLFSQRWITLQQRTLGGETNLSAAQQMLTAVEYFWLQERRPPTVLTELQTHGYSATIWQPWPAQWQVERQANMLRLKLPFSDLAMAQKISEQLPGAQLNSANQLVLHVFEPIQLALYERYLHRTEVDSAPQYNQMEADLNLNGYSLRNVGTLDAQRVVGSSATLASATFTTLHADVFSSTELHASNATLGSHDVVALANRVTQLNAQWNQCLANGGCQ